MQTQYFSAFSVFCLPLIIATSLKAGEPSVQDLIDMAPVLKSSDENIHNMDIRGYVKLAGIGYVSVRASYCGPNERPLMRDTSALVVRDREDGTPILLASDDKCFIYSCIKPELVYIPRSAKYTMILNEKLGAVNFSFQVNSALTPQPAITLDIKSLLAVASNGDKVVKTGSRSYRLSRIDGLGDTRVYHINLDNPTKYEKIEVFPPGETEPALCIEKIVVNGEASVPMPTFPTRGRLAETQITLTEVPDGALPGASSPTAIMFRAVISKISINHPEARHILTRSGISNVDWNKVKENERVSSRLLRQLVLSE